MPALVETYSGGRLHERPRRFCRQGAWLAVAELLAAWQEPGALCFRVRADDGHLYHLQYNRETDAWEVAPLDPGVSGQEPG